MGIFFSCIGLSSFSPLCPLLRLFFHKSEAQQALFHIQTPFSSSLIRKRQKQTCSSGLRYCSVCSALSHLPPSPHASFSLLLFLSSIFHVFQIIFLLLIFLPVMFPLFFPVLSPFVFFLLPLSVFHLPLLVFPIFPSHIWTPSRFVALLIFLSPSQTPLLLCLYSLLPSSSFLCVLHLFFSPSDDPDHVSLCINKLLKNSFSFDFCFFFRICG